MGERLFGEKIKMGKKLLLIVVLVFILSLISVSASWQPYVVGNWTFDIDRNETINNYAPTGGIFNSVTGYKGQAVNLTAGSITYGEIYHFGGYNQNPSNVTWVAIVKPDADYTGYQSILASDSIGLGGQYGYNLEIVGADKLRTYYGYYSSASDGNKNRKDSICSVPKGEWMMIAGSMYNATEMRIFVNGVEWSGTFQAGYPDMSQRNDISSPMQFGYNAKGGAYKGLLDDVLLIKNYIDYNDAWEIAQAYGLEQEVQKLLFIDIEVDNDEVRQYFQNNYTFNYSGYQKYDDCYENVVDTTVYDGIYNCTFYVNESVVGMQLNVNLSQQNNQTIPLPLLNGEAVNVTMFCENPIHSQTVTEQLILYNDPRAITQQLQKYYKHNDAGTKMWDEITQTAGSCSPAGCGQNPYGYYGYYKPEFDGKFDEASLWGKGTFGKSCDDDYSATGITDGISFNLWIKPDFYKENLNNMFPIQFISSQCNSNPFRGNRLFFNNESIKISYSGGTLTAPFNMTTDTWYMITATWGANGMTIYANGEKIANNPSLTSYTVYPVLDFGGEGNSEYTLFGVMDETAVWSRQLDDYDVDILWNDGKGYEIIPEERYTPMNGTTLSEDIASYHSFDVDPIDDLGFAEYPRTSVDVLHDDPKLGGGYLYCRGSSRTTSDTFGTMDLSKGYTVGAWFRAPENHVQNNYLYQAIDSAFISSSFLPYVGGYSPFISPELNYTGDINDSTWHFALSKYHPEENRTYHYYDGQLVGSYYSSTVSPPSPPSSIAICKLISSQSSYADLDEYFVFERALTDSEIAILYSGYQLYSGGTPPTECRDVLTCATRWYSFDELNGTNVSDSGLDDVTSVTSLSGNRQLGFINRALNFSDTVESITIDNSNINLSWYDVSDYSVNFWYYKNTNPSSTQRFLEQKATTNQEWWTYFYQLSGGQLQYCVGRYGVDGQCITSPVLSSGWNMITATFNHTDFNMTLYVNTTESGTAIFERVNTLPADVDWQVKELTVGREYEFLIDELRFYDWEISPYQVEELYNWSLENQGCNENWQPIYGACQVDDNQTLVYEDLNACGSIIDLPVDNGTITTCDYCENQYHLEDTACSFLQITTFAVYDNYGTCCALTNLTSDCQLPANSTGACQQIGIHDPSSVGGVIIDFLVEYWIMMLTIVSLLVLLFLYLLWRYLKDNGYL